MLHARKPMLHARKPMFRRLTCYFAFVYPYKIYNVIDWGNTNQIHFNPSSIKNESSEFRTFCNSSKFDHKTLLFYR